MSAFARWLGRHPLWMLGANLIVTAVLGVYALRIHVESSVESLLPADDPEVRYYERARARFGNDEIAVVGVQARDLFATPTLEKIARLTTALAGIKGVERVLSITNAVDPAADPANPPRLLAAIPPPPGAIDRLKKKLAETPLYRSNLIAPDDSGAAINIYFTDLTDAQYLELGIDEHIRHLLRVEHGSLSYTGAAHLQRAAAELMRRDLMRFTPIALGLLVMVLWLSFRTVRGVLLPVISVTLALVWTLGVMVLAGKGITMGTFILPPLLIVIGSSYGIHVMARYYERVAGNTSPDERVVGAFELVAPALLISALTTMIGFGSLMTNRITGIWDLGLFAVVGVLLVSITSLTFIPAMLQVMNGRSGSTSSGRVPSWLLRALHKLGERASLSRSRTFWAAVLIAVVALAGAWRLRVDSDFLYVFKPRSEVRRANETINREIVGTNALYLVVEGEQPGTLQRWEVLKEIKDLQDFLRTLPGITSSVSLVDYVEVLDAAAHQGGAAKPGAATLWDDPTRLRAALSRVSANPASFRSVVTEDFRAGNVLVRTSVSGSQQVAALLERIRAYAAEHFPDELQVHPTGGLVLLAATTADIVRGQITSLSLALAVIFLVLTLMFLSAKVGFLALLPNVLAIAIFFGVMGWLGIYLNLGTSLIAAIALGIAVDATIHYMTRLNRELRGETDQVAAVVRTFEAVGPPIIYTTAALFFGFLTFAFSSFVPIQNFGVLTGVTILAALGSNLFLLPALLATTKVITLWDLLALRLGQSPVQTIPLFAGLRPAQARIVVLLGQVKRFAPGEFIVRRGECGDEMYLIMQGRAEVWAGNGDDRRPVADLRRGEVFGEMGAIRHNQRSADVVAAEPVEALAVNERFLERLQVRYPRIAAQVFLNLTRIVSDRLQRMTDQYVKREA